MRRFFSKKPENFSFSLFKAKKALQTAVRYDSIKDTRINRRFCRVLNI